MAALIAIACLLFGLSSLHPTTLRDYDQPLYLGIASDLLDTGLYTNGRFGEPLHPGAYVAPLYPAMIAGLARLDPTLARTAACVRRAPDAELADCPDKLGLLLPVQFALGVITLLLVWRSTLAIGGSPAAAWCALVAAGLGTTEYAVYVRTAMTEALSLPLAALVGLLLVMLVRHPRWATSIGLGVALGLLTLTRPEYLYLALGIGLVGAGAAVLRRPLGARLVVAMLVCALVLAPWSQRNERLFGTLQPTYGYSAFILAQRMAYQAMTPLEWTAQWLYALPGFGPAAARMVFHHGVDRLGWQDRPDTFYMVGNTTMQTDMAQAAPDVRDRVGYLLHRYVWTQPVRFAAVTIVMTWKTLWVRKYFSLVAMPFFAVLVWRAMRRRDSVRLAFVLPPLFILLLHGATTVGTPRYSLMMIPVYAASFGLIAGPWAATGLERLRRRTSTPLPTRA